MTIWVVRAGRNGERENFATEKKGVFIGWARFGDMSNYRTKEEIRSFLKKMNPDWRSGTLGINTGQFFRFIQEIKVGDTIAMPLKKQRAIMFGKVTGDYEFIAKYHSDDCCHSRKVEWREKPIPRRFFEQGILNSFGSALTVFGIRGDKEGRIRKVIERNERQQTDADITSNEAETEEEEEKLNLEELARDGISDFIGRKFKGHRMEDLVAEVLEAQGFEVRRNTSKGPDGGVDVLAGKGPMGFDKPLLAVQVKSGDSPINSDDYKKLKGVLPDFGATHGLFVSWGGFNSAVEKDAKKDFFKIRLWNAEDLVREIQGVYPNLPKAIQAELPMKQIWLSIDDADEI